MQILTFIAFCSRQTTTVLINKHINGLTLENTRQYGCTVITFAPNSGLGSAVNDDNIYRRTARTWPRRRPELLDQLDE